MENLFKNYEDGTVFNTFKELCDCIGIPVPDGSSKNNVWKRLESHAELIKGTKPGEKRKRKIKAKY